MNNDCYKKAIRLLTQRDYSRPKLAKKLIAAGFEEDDSKIVVQKLYEEGLLKEDWYIEARVKGLMRKNYSPKHIKQRLAQEELDVSEDYIDSICNDHGMDEPSQINTLIEKKGSRYASSWPNLSYEERYKIKMKLVRSLVSKGFSPNQGLKAIESFFNHD